MKTECYIVQDLLPSYAEKLTSDRTSADVKEHLEECDQCLKLYEAMAEKIHIKNDSGNIGQIDYLKKIKNRFKKRSIISAAMLIIIIYFFIAQYFGFYMYMNINQIMLILPIFIVIGYFTLYDGFNKGKNIGLDFWILNGLVVIISLGTIIITRLVGRWCELDNPFGLKIYQLGPWAFHMISILGLLLFILVIYGIAKSLKKSLLYYIMACNAISGICTIAGCNWFLRTLSDYRDIYTNPYIFIYAEGLILTTALWIWMKHKKTFI